MPTRSYLLRTRGFTCPGRLAALVAVACLTISWSAVAMTAADTAKNAESASTPAANRLVPYAEFVADLKKSAPAPRNPLAATQGVEEARQYLLGRYDGVNVAHSFMSNGQIFDCFAVADQPSFRLGGQTSIATPPPFAPPGSEPGAATVPALPEQTDAYGNRQACAAGAVPIRRITLDEIAGFGSLRRFFAKDLSDIEAGEDADRSGAGSPNPANRLNLSGRWVGEESQPGAPIPHQTIMIDLGTTDASGIVSGVSSQGAAANTQYHAIASLSGVAGSTGLTFRQTAFRLRSVAAGTRWCLSTANLTYSVTGAGPTLSGSLTAPGCKPATVKLAHLTSSHKYAVRGQSIGNLGGSSSIGIWKPALNPSVGEIFSLAQQWYAAGTGARLQTAEVGWQEYPEKYGTFNPTLFIYWTADNYNKTGCYNSDCTAYVQTDSTIAPGRAFTKYGLNGKGVYAIPVGFYLNNGAWWLAYAGKWIGYYPATLYKGGGMSTRATSIEFGGETVGAGSWPAMGSGYFASRPSAAVQENVSYYDSAGKLLSATVPYPIEPSRNCYTLTADGMKKGNSYFFFGGPGGKRC